MSPNKNWVRLFSHNSTRFRRGAGSSFRRFQSHKTSLKYQKFKNIKKHFIYRRQQGNKFSFQKGKFSSCEKYSGKNDRCGYE